MPTRKTLAMQSQVNQATPSETGTAMHFCTYPSLSHPAIKESTCFSFQGPLKGHCVILEDVKAETAQQGNVATWWLSPTSHHCHIHPYTSTSTGPRLTRPDIWVWVICRVEYLHSDPDPTMTQTKTR